MTARVLLVISARLDDAAREAVTAGDWPRKDFFELQRVLGADVIDYTAVERCWTGRAMCRIVGLAGTQAWLAFRRRAAYDAIITDGEHLGIPLALLLKLVNSKAAHVTIGHRLSARKKQPFFRWLKIHSHIGQIALHATRQYELAIAEMGIPPEHLALVPYQVDPEFWRPQACPEERLVCSVGRECRDYPTLFQAVDGLDARVVIGAASHWSRRPNTAMGCERPPNVAVNRFDYRALRDLYARSAVVVVPLDDTDFQAGVTTILEAMAMGKAVVVTRTRGQTDVVEDRRAPARAGEPQPEPISLLRTLAQQAGIPIEPNGFYVPPGDPAALRRAIVYLLDHPAERSRLGAAGRRAIERLFTVDQFVQRLCALVEQAYRPPAGARAARGAPIGLDMTRSRSTYEGEGMILFMFGVLLTLLAAGLLLQAGYLCGLTVAAFFGRKDGPPAASARRRFAVVIPAHNEEALIRRLLENLRQLHYPKDGFDIYVVADNCDDQTAALARSLGACVYERFDRSAQGKGFALRWLFQQIGEERRDYDAFVVLDADSVVAPNLLRSMDARLNAGSQVIQAYYSVLNPAESPLAELRYAALAALHYLRPLGRSALGLSCGLKGNGMCFAAPVLARFAWRWFTLAEDVEFHLALARAGIRVDFAPETSVLADMPISYAQAASQNARWERGRLQLLRHEVPSLLAEGVRRRSPLRLDAAAEQLIPPLSVPFALGGLILGAALGLGLGIPATLAALSLLGQIVYLVAALVLVRAPWRTYLALGHAPAYVAWKVGLYVRALLRTRSMRWIRTARAVGPSHSGRLPEVPAISYIDSQPGQRRSDA